jgi:hypothetical protein
MCLGKSRSLDYTRGVAILLFLGSVVLLLGVARVKKIPFISPYGIFLVFQCLYNLVPFCISLTGLGMDRQAILAQLVLAASANVTFALAFWIWYRPNGLPRPQPGLKSGRLNYLLILFPVFLGTLLLCHLYGWHTFASADAAGVPGGAPYTITAYSKHFFIACYLYYIYKFGLDRYAWYLFVGVLVVMGVDGGRTDFFPAIVLTLMIWREQSKTSRLKLVLLCSIGLFAVVAARSLVISGGSAVAKFGATIFTEGTMGSYPCTQSIYALQHSGRELPYSFGASYIVDPLLWILPQGGSGTGGDTFLSRWVDAIYGVIPGEFAPMGGFYYMAEAIAAFGWGGPAIVAFVFGALITSMERNKQRFPLLYLAFMSTVGLLFVKTIFGNVFKLFVVQLIFLVAFNQVRKVKALLSASLLANGQPRQGAAGRSGDNYEGSVATP